MTLYPSFFNPFGNRLQPWSLLAIRIVLGYGFWGPGTAKLMDLQGISVWFGSMGYPFPYLSAVLAGGTETLGAVLLVSGFLVRWISFPLLVIMAVAIATVHLPNGFEASANGFEIPLYYSLLLLVLVQSGAGSFSLDAVFGQAGKRK
ncbi:MAG: DoxX family protein [Bacteroidetes bacterium]|nr:DoxX family protein [Bacteroidota bacterium]